MDEDKTISDKYCKWCIIELCEEFKPSLLDINKFLHKIEKHNIETINEMKDIIQLGMLEI
jgi:hypothetical protein